MTEQEFYSIESGDILELIRDKSKHIVIAVNLVKHYFWGSFREIVAQAQTCPFEKRYIYSKEVLNNLDRFRLVPLSELKAVTK